MEKNNQPLIITAIIGGIVLIIALALIFTRNGDDAAVGNQINPADSQEENGNDNQQPSPNSKAVFLTQAELQDRVESLKQLRGKMLAWVQKHNVQEAALQDYLSAFDNFIIVYEQKGEQLNAMSSVDQEAFSQALADAYVNGVQQRVECYESSPSVETQNICLIEQFNLLGQKQNEILHQFNLLNE